MNGWWWNPAGPGRGFFVEYRDGKAWVACCLYAKDGAPEWHTAGPLPLGADDSVAGRSHRMALSGGPGERDLRLQFRSRSSAVLEWGGECIALEPQHRELRERAGDTDDPMTGAWREEGVAAPCVLACEQIGRRAVGALLAPDGWLFLDAERRSGDRHAGPWWRFEGGQSLGGPHRAPVGRQVSPASVQGAADEGLVVRMPDGAERRFRRLAFDGDARPIERPPRSLYVELAIPQRLRSGLIALELTIDAGRAFADCTYNLRLEPAQGGAALFEKSVHLAGWARKVELLVNSHLLPNGDVPLLARLSRGGKDAWRRSFTLEVSNTGPLAERVRASLRSRGSPLVIDGLADSVHYAMADRALLPWFDQDDAPERIRAWRREGRISAAEEEALASFVRDGYMVLADAIEEPLLARIDGELDDAIAGKVQGYEYGSSQRIVNLHQRYRGIRALWRHPAVMRHLELVFGVPARPCQTLTYIFGSQQEAHQDTVHLTPFPAGYMCGVWVAIDDVQPNSGELEIFPGTHRLARVYMEGSGCAKVTDNEWAEFGEKVVGRYREMLRSGGFGKITYRPKRGTVLVWHENLLHGGSVRLDMSLSRRSIVSHYFADGAIAFYDSTGRPGNMD